MNARQRFTAPAGMSEFPIRQVLKRVSERNAFTSAMRAKWNEKLSALLFPSQRYYAVMCGFCRSLRGFHDESHSRSRRIKSSFITSHARAANCTELNDA